MNLLETYGHGTANVIDGIKNDVFSGFSTGNITKAMNALKSFHAGIPYTVERKDPESF